MKQAALKLCGVHDFRNFCSMSMLMLELASNKPLQTFVRNIFECDIYPVQAGGDGMMVFYVKGKAFLWHQVRRRLSLGSLYDGNLVFHWKRVDKD